ncbi:hypothetical protein [Rathayibacter tanaceti]|uniref:Uncharacterized protein n=2 Tax=Rathayibacter tanaceti TaxID=1671680 RepID=A0A162FMU5_9MICO|nr:hypothetical protein [Rathayibacter tanaceti]KZX19745.1 hypothetical protein ACH61_03155 [Rathayibacter tanaceti]QHC55197.1 hypothetical protein GSU10_05830 [Rathayibacter tanaceti]TCO36516.1 hypothetical protein EV639_107196 [Rathayibacter tanaceti]
MVREDSQIEPREAVPTGDAALDDLTDALLVIEEQPLAARSSEYSRLQEHLRRRLENADRER